MSGRGASAQRLGQAGFAGDRRGLIAGCGGRGSNPGCPGRLPAGSGDVAFLQMPSGRAVGGEAPASSRRQHGGVWRVSSGAPGLRASSNPWPPKRGLGPGCGHSAGSWALSTTHHTAQHPCPSTPKGSNFRQSQAPTHSCRQVPAPAAKPWLCPSPKYPPHPAPAQLPLICPGLRGAQGAPHRWAQLGNNGRLWLFRSPLTWSCPGCFIIKPWESHAERLTTERGAGAKSSPLL